VENELTDFLRYCRLERRLAETTCKAHERDVRACLAFFRERGIAELAAVRPPELRAFLAAEAERRPAVSNQTRTVAALKVFFRFCVENEYLDRDPALVLCTPKKREALPDMLDRRELLGLDWNDVDLERRLLKVRKAKGGRQRVIPIPPRAGASVRRLPALPRSRPRAAAIHRRPGEAALADDHGAHVPAIRARRRRDRAQACDAAHAPARVRLRALARGRKPAPDPGAA
jgi:site-specific recombinase XerD